MALHKFFTKHHIILHKGKNRHILLTLAWNQFHLLRLWIYKSLHGIHRPIVHYYAVCWNEERMLPFVFRHYDDFVSQYVFFDNESTDHSQSIILSHPDSHVKTFHTDGFDDNVHNDIKNSCWKKSRGRADYVIVCDVDEMLYHKDMQQMLAHALKYHISFFRPEGWDMYSEHFPPSESPLTDSVTRGVRSTGYGKSILFDPHRIVDINYEPGAHFCHPTGIVKASKDNGLKVLHYKNLGLDYIMSRIRAYRGRLTERIKAEGFAVHYTYADKQIEEDFEKGLTKAEKAF